VSSLERRPWSTSTPTRLWRKSDRLGADYLLEGSTSERGESRFHVSAQLIRVHDQNSVWGTRTIGEFTGLLRCRKNRTRHRDTYSSHAGVRITPIENSQKYCECRKPMSCNRRAVPFGERTNG